MVRFIGTSASVAGGSYVAVKWLEGRQQQWQQQRQLVALCLGSAVTLTDSLTKADHLFDSGIDGVEPLNVLLRKVAASHGIDMAAIEAAGIDEEKLKQVSAAVPKAAASSAILWRMSRSARLLTQDPTKPAAEREKNAKLCHACAQLAVWNDVDQISWESHKWLGISYSVLGDFLGIKQKLKNSFKIREEFEQSIKMNGNDATVQHLLGYWFFYFADMSWIERNVASVLFAEPPQGTYEQALEWLQKAHQLDPEYKRNLYYLAATWQRLGNAEKAKQWQQKCLAIECKSRDDEEFDEKARKLF